MRIGLVIPPSLILSDERFFVHIGILKVAAILEQKDILVDVLDLSGVGNYLDSVRSYVMEHTPSHIGFTATSPQIPAATEIAKEIRKLRPSIRLILGGPHITLVNIPRRREVAKGIEGRGVLAFKQLESYFDIFVMGDGELAVFDALRENSPKIIDADDPKSTSFLTKNQLTELPLPARHLVDINSYHYKIDGVSALSMICQLGCPFGCAFCGGRESPFLRKVRLRSTESVIAEFRHIYERYGFRAIMLYDDELNVNPRMIELMQAIAHLGKDLGVEWRLRGFIKAELFTDDQAEAMKEAGFREILTGFESGSPRILENINKKATLEDNNRCVAIARRHGLRTKALMSIGHAGETEATIRETMDWILEIHPESFDLTRITVYPGTPYFDWAIPHEVDSDVFVFTAKNGDRLYSRNFDYTEDFMYYKGDRGDRLGLNKFHAWTDALTADNLTVLRFETEAELRKKLGQEFQTDAAPILYDHSMGQGLPDSILRSTRQ
ncbi:MAG: radical SAM protein [Patescibacteria group bacterium]